MTRGGADSHRTHTYGIMARHRASSIERDIGKNDRAMRRRTARHGYNGAGQATIPPRRQTATLRLHPHQGGRSKERGRERPAASKHGEPKQHEAKSQSGEQIARHNRQPPRPPCRETGREKRKTDPPDGTTNEARDGQAGHPARRDENTADIAAEPAKQADRGNPRPQMIRNEPAIDIGTDHRTKPKQARTPTLPASRPAQPCRGSGEATGRDDRAMRWDAVRERTPRSKQGTRDHTPDETSQQRRHRHKQAAEAASTSHIRLERRRRNRTRRRPAPPGETKSGKKASTPATDEMKENARR